MFAKAGGPHLRLTDLRYAVLPLSGGDDYGTAYERTLKTAELVRAQTKIVVFVAVGPYPVDLLALDEKLGLAGATAAMKRGMDIAAKLTVEGKVTAIGEIGRPHFPVASDLWRASNEILSHGMAVAKDAGCAVILHTEDPTPA